MRFDPDLTDKLGKNFAPATGALIAPIELASGTKAYFVGKPNPIMMRHGRKLLGCEREDTAIIGDRMDTDIIAGIHVLFPYFSGLTLTQERNHI